MTKQSNPELQELLKHADKYLELVIAFFRGVQEKVEEVKQDPTWGTVTDDVKGEPAAEAKDVDPMDEYIMTLETRIDAYLRAGNMHAAGALRRVVNDLTGLDDKDS